MNVKVSVVIPTYNRAADVLRAARAALNQTLPPHQIIVVDDGSTDDTETVIRALPSPVVYIRKPNGGVSSARNLGFQLVTGDYVAMLDSDDYWAPEWLEAATRAIERRPDAGAAVCTTVYQLTPKGEPLGAYAIKARPVDGVIPLANLLRGSAMGSNFLLRTDVLRRVGDFALDLRTGEDIDFALRVAVATTIVSVPEPCVHVTSSESSLSKNINTGNRLVVYDRFEQRFPTHARRHAAALRAARIDATLGYARDLIWDRQLQAARARLRESWSYGPSWAAAKLMLKLTVLSLVGGKKAAKERTSH